MSQRPKAFGGTVQEVMSSEASPAPVGLTLMMQLRFKSVNIFIPFTLNELSYVFCVGFLALV